jgi:hypothetical protein
MTRAADRAVNAYHPMPKQARDLPNSQQYIFRGASLTSAAQLADTERAADLHDVTPPSASNERRSDADARRYVRLTLGHTLAMYGVLGATLLNVLPAWTLVVAVPWLYLRLSLGLHELLHVCDATEVPAFHRLAMIFDTPAGLGFREHRVIHFRHHRFGGGERDPERWQIEGGHLHAFAQAMTTPERSFVEWVRTRGVDGVLLRDGAFRLAVFAALVALNPMVFLVYWTTLRVCIGGAGFVFHHLLHNRRGALGTYALPFPLWLVHAGRTIFGDEPMLILTRHRSHHLWPRIRVRDLPELPATFALPPGPISAMTLAAAARYALPTLRR